MAHGRPLIDLSASFRLRSSIVFRLTLAIVVAFCQAFFGLRVRGRRNLRPVPAFLVSNHSLTLDPGVVAAAIRPARTWFSALEKTFDVPVLGEYIRLLGAFPIPRKRPLERLRPAIARALQVLGFVHFFPEGRLRARRRDVAGFHDGVFLLSALSGIPVIPIVIVARRRRLLGRAVRWLPPLIDVVVAEAVDPAGFGRRGIRPRDAARSMNRHVRALMRSILAAADTNRSHRRVIGS